MAKAQAIAVTGQAVLGLLAENIPKSEFTDARFELYQPANFKTPMKEGISLFLYRVEINAGLRNIPYKTGADGLSRRPSLPLDLHYLLQPGRELSALPKIISTIANMGHRDPVCQTASKLIFGSRSDENIKNYTRAFQIDEYILSTVRI